MGMFDEIICDAALPDGDDLPDTTFQTKSFPNPCMFRYRITVDGRLIDSDGNDIEPDGYISFYTTEERRLTLREYRAHFSAGQLQDIVRVDADAQDNRRYGLASYRWFETHSYMFGPPDDDAA